MNSVYGRQGYVYHVSLQFSTTQTFVYASSKEQLSLHSLVSKDANFRLPYASNELPIQHGRPIKIVVYWPTTKPEAKAIAKALD